MPCQIFDEFGLISIRSSNDLRADVGFWELIVSNKKLQKQTKQNKQHLVFIWTKYYCLERMLFERIHNIKVEHRKQAKTKYEFMQKTH